MCLQVHKSSLDESGLNSRGIHSCAFLPLAPGKRSENSTQMPSGSPPFTDIPVYTRVPVRIPTVIVVFTSTSITPPQIPQPTFFAGSVSLSKLHLPAALNSSTLNRGIPHQSFSPSPRLIQETSQDMQLRECKLATVGFLFVEQLQLQYFPVLSSEY